MTYDKLLLIANALVCFVMFFRGLYFKRGDKNYSKLGGWLAWLFLGYSISVPVFSYLDPSYQAGFQNLIPNSFLCAALFAKRGNVMQLLKKVG
ncbi:phage holin family protein [Morganella morganii]|uniref:phage holin family protein n=1 Tax=Morganella morganii TaxID=582 RepID=UPI0032DA178B|nr:phage holin family protein [Morganella morganii]